jgi:hypothetical protein
MAVQFHKQPTKFLNPVYDDIVFSVKNATQGVFNHKFVIKVFVNTNASLSTYVEQATLKAVANDVGKAHFNISNILQDFCEIDVDGYADISQFNSSSFDGVHAHTEQHNIHVVDDFALNKNNLKKYYVVATEEFSTTANGEIIEQTSVVTSDRKLVWNATRQLEDGFETFNADTLLLSGSDCFFLSGLPSTVNRKIQATDYHTLAFFSGKFGSTNAQESLVDKINFEFFNASGSSIQTVQKTNNVTNGGNIAGTTLDFTNPNLTFTAYGLLYVGVGLKNLNNAGVVYSTASTKYEVKALDSTGAVVSDTYTFEIQDADCKGFETIRLAYLNRLGAYDYYNFTKKSTRTTEINRANFKQHYGSYNTDNYSQGTYLGGNTSYRVNAIETIEANTDFITESEATTLEELFTSPLVYMQLDNGVFVKVMVNEKNYVKQTIVNDKLIQYVIDIQKSNETRIQNI